MPGACSAAAALLILPIIGAALRHRSDATEAAGAGDKAMRPLLWLPAHRAGKYVADHLSATAVDIMTHATNGSAVTKYYTGNLPPVPEYGIPALKMMYAVPGVGARTLDEASRVTDFPCFLALASSWDKKLVSEVATASAEEFKALGANVMLGPVLNVHRSIQHALDWDTLSGEDPTLGSVLGKAWISAAQDKGVMVVPRALGLTEQSPLHLLGSKSNATIWDIYYPPFQAAVDTGVGGIMCAAREENGLWACRDSALINRDLRGIMGFKGVVISDLGGAMDNFAYESSFERGLDVSLSSPQVLAATDKSKEAMTRGVEMLVSAYTHMNNAGMAGCTPPDCESELAANARSQAHSAVAKAAAASAVVLLKNAKNLLPLLNSQKLLAISGPAAFAAGSQTSEDYYSGVNEGHIPRTDYIPPFDAIKAKATSLGFKVTTSIKGADICIVIGGAANHEEHWHLDQESVTAIDAAAATCPKTVVLLQINGAVLTPWEGKVTSIMSMFHAGEETGNAWALTLFGDVTPSGKLPISFPKSAQQRQDWWNEGIPSYWSPSSEFTPAFEFGFGLSYTKFEYTKVVEKPGCLLNLCLMVHVSNAGSYAGAEVVQVYLKLADGEGHPTVLRGFEKTKLLNPGEEDKVWFEFSYHDLSLYRDVNGQAMKGLSWKAQKSIKVLVGSSSLDIRHSLTVNAKV